MKLYPWQRSCLRAWKEHRFRGIVHVATGAGKTVMALSAVRLLQKSIPNPLCVRVVVPTVALARQWRSSMVHFLPDCASGKYRPGQYGGGRKDSPSRRYMIYVVNSARSVLADHILEDLRAGRDVLLIADECHHYASPENRNIFPPTQPVSELPGRYYSLGLSATPQVSGYDSVLAPGLGEEIYRYDIQKAASEKTLSPYCIYQIALSFLADENEEYNELSARLYGLLKQIYREYPSAKEMPPNQFFAFMHRLAGDDPESLAANYLKLTLARSQITYLAAARSACTLDLIGQLGLSHQILIFGERIQQAETVYAALNRKFSGRVGRYHSAMPPQARRQVLEDFRSGQLRILVTCRALDEGVDVPEASIGIILSGTSVSRQRIQRLGRLLRRSAEKTAACMYYLYVKESAEENAFLADVEDEFPICNLSYEIQDRSFTHERYDAAAAAVLDKAHKQGLDEKSLKEMRRCLLDGQLKPDWLLPEQEVAKRIANARQRREKNYWVCVREMMGE